MHTVAAIGAAHRVEGWSLAGALVLPAEDAAAVRAAWSRLPAEVCVLVLGPQAAAALAEVEEVPGRLRVVLPP
jgi:hypothetical protein